MPEMTILKEVFSEKVVKFGEINKLKTRYIIENDRIWRFDSFK